MDEKQTRSDRGRQMNGEVDRQEGQSGQPSNAVTETDDHGQAAAERPEVNEIDAQQLREELEQERAKATEYLEQAQRARAELINYRRRVDQETEQLRRYASEQILRQILPALDDFHRAVEAVPEDERDNAWIQGILLIERKLWSTMDAAGVSPIEAVGKPFDPSMHEAVMVEEGADGADTVVAEFQRGYMLHDRVLRAAMVKVGHGSSVEERSEEQQGS